MIDLILFVKSTKKDKQEVRVKSSFFFIFKIPSDWRKEGEAWQKKIFFMKLKKV